MAKAVSYLRVSGLGQVDGSGFERQRDTIAAWCRQNRVELLREYQEKGVSGTTTETDRPAFQEMVSDLLSNGCKTIVIESLDRFARDLCVQMQLLAYVKSKGLTLISALTGDNITEDMDADPMRKAMVQIQGVFAELEKSLLVRKLRKARTSKKAAGEKVEGPKFYGEFEGEAEIVERIKALRRKPRGGERLSYAAIAEKLNAEGVPTRNGGPWRPSTVQQICKRE